MFKFIVRLIFGGPRPPKRSIRVRPTTPVSPARVPKPQLQPQYGQKPKTVRRTTAPSTLSGKCWVVDGDTIIIQKQRIRLFGIDAPELNHPYGKNSKWAMMQLTKGQTIEAIVTDDTSYERLVARCYLPDGRDLSAELVKLGLAIDWPRFSGGIYRPLEVPDARQKMWRADAKQKGKFFEKIQE